MNFILAEKKQSVTWITLNRPNVFNSFNRQMALELLEALDRAEADEESRCIVLTGGGKAFCAGQDLQEAMDPNGPGLEKIISEHYNPIIKKLRTIQKPVIAGVNGVAAGAGANIALACDIVVACESASFIQAFSKIGLIPDSGGTFFLPRLMGWNRASALMLTGDRLMASDALQCGLLYKVWSDERFMEELELLSQSIATKPTRALLLTRALLNASLTNSLDEQLEMEKEYQLIAGSSYDFQEGVRAFIEKRTPQFKGH